ncbi:MAG: hypothetical protein HZC36_14680 [Armatimonadetes bacterium]|nr:hypothetical protein [Armatimonadota bacterium]
MNWDEELMARSTESVRTYSNIIPRRRGSGGQPKPRTIVGARPLVTLAPDALRQSGEAFGRSVDEGRQSLPRLKAASALAASDNAASLRRSFEERMAIQSSEAKMRVADLEPALRALEAELAGHCSLLSAVAGPLGFCSVQDRQGLDFEEGEPVSLEVLAGRHQLPAPEEHVGWAQRTGYKLLAGIGGGTVFGISLGLLTGKLELYSLAEEWPWLFFWSGLGIAVMTLVGASLYPLGRGLGGLLYRAAIRTPWIGSFQMALTFLMLSGLVACLVLIESKVEQLGLFKAIGEQSTLQGFKVSQADLFWVSLMLVVPTVASYVVLGVREGERLAGLAHLKSLQEDARAAIRALPEYALAAWLHPRVKHLSGRKAVIESQISAEKVRIRSEFTVEEQQRLEDMDMDAALASYDAEDFLIGLCRGVDGRWNMKRGTWDWLWRFLGDRRRQRS